MNRDALRARLAKVAGDAAQAAGAKAPMRSRIVVVVTDFDGKWVGVGHNTDHADCVAILRSALIGPDLVFHVGPTMKTRKKAKRK